MIKQAMVAAVLLVLAANPVHSQSTYQGETRDKFDQVRDTAHVCYDSGSPVLLSRDERPKASSCSRFYAECQGDRCMTVVHGAIKRLDKGLLLQFGGDVLAEIRRREEAGIPAASFPSFNPWATEYADPVCSWYHSLGFDCPEGAAVPGGGSNGGGSGPPPSTPLPPGQDDNCFLCSLNYVGCFAQAGANLIAQSICIRQFRSCAARRCG